MRNANSLLVLALTLFASGAVAQAAPRSLPAVKVRSTSDSGQALAGSGTVFAENGRTWVLTSDHVLFHSTERARHAIQTEDGQSATALLRAVDWGKGLALLEVAGAIRFKSKIPALSSFASFDPAPRTALQVGAFPHQSESLLQDSRVAVLNPRSLRHDIALLDSMIELAVDAKVEYGMSGGGAYSADGKRLVGILSHQYVEMIPGRPSRTGEIVAGSQERQNHVFAISSVDAAKWVRGALQDTPVPPSFVLDPDAQALGKTVVLSGRLRFEHACAPSDGPKGVGGGDGVGVGGGDGVGVGGGDGVGTGGGGSGDPQECFVRISLRKADRGLPALNSTPAIASWSEAVARALESGRSAKATGFVVINDQGAMRRREITSLAMFFHQLSRSPDSVLTELDGNDRLDALTAEGQRLGQAVSAIRAAAPMLGAEARSLLVELETVGHWAKSFSRSRLEPGYLDQLERNPAWNYLFKASFDPAVEAMNRLIRVKEAIKALP
jgi:hypothetical protein